MEDKITIETLFEQIKKIEELLKELEENSITNNI